VRPPRLLPRGSFERGDLPGLQVAALELGDKVAHAAGGIARLQHGDEISPPVRSRLTARYPQSAQPPDGRGAQSITRP
jgi:hypothetical protein